ncbi:hypothetical protein I203_106236 [Kwoniella mangroviensis CBS 8507]|uniref:uncharacterized protein n=1 Tax=Kwoniella mangroviensis CBS 8507 TaxID=1296122 RepID=UPI00080D282F|nr:uncharacterized protein I203_04710 [Kwoniella mangroviensis CBS 8507]OCF66377.1 hypothetical protein I203_04710 [Kwoniella mangroviensis CBS 8507]
MTESECQLAISMTSNCEEKQLGHEVGDAFEIICLLPTTYLLSTAKAMPRTILITGATGQQGGATLRALAESIRLSEGLSIRIRILALTRDASSEKANTSLSIPGVQVVQGDLNDKSSIDKIFELYAIDSVFSVQDVFQGNEVEQGTTLVDVAVKHGVKHFVYTSVGMSGLSPSPVPHFETKRQIEGHLKSRSSQSQILSMGTKWNPNQRFKHIATSDIGQAAAEILIAGSQEKKFRKRIIYLTGDAHTPDEIRKIFKEGRNVSWEDSEQDVEVGTELTNALNTINVHPFEGTPEETRKLFPWVKDLPIWLDTEFHAGLIIG